MIADVGFIDVSLYSWVILPCTVKLRSTVFKNPARYFKISMYCLHPHFTYGIRSMSNTYENGQVRPLLVYRNFLSEQTIQSNTRPLHLF